MVGVLVTSLVLALSASPQTTQPAAAATPVITVPAAGEMQELLLKDGTRAIGRVENIADGRFTFRTGAGVVMEVAIDQVKSVGAVSGEIVNGDFWPADANPTRLFFAPTGRSLKRGEAYLGVYQVFMPFVQVGLTDRITIGGGTPLFLVFLGSDERPFWLSPKIQLLETGSTSVSAGVLHFANMGDWNMGIAYGVVTQGSANAAVSVGVGYAYLRGDPESNGGAPVLMVGGEQRVSRRVKLITENYFFTGHKLLSAGIRVMGERLSADLAVVSPLEGNIIAFPMVNLVWKLR